MSSHSPARQLSPRFISRSKFFLAAIGAALALVTVPRAAMAKEPASLQSFNERAEKGARLNVVFFGGSLTWGANASDPLTTSYRGLMMKYLTAKYPKAHFSFYDAAIGGSGSNLGMFRLERDVLKYKPDLVFLEFTMNDGADEVDPQRLATYEHLLREILKSGSAVQPVITTFRFFVDKPEEPKLPLVEEHLKLAEAYRLPAANVHQSIRDAVAAKKADVAVLWPFDGAHPDDEGYRWFFDVVRDQFEKNIAGKTKPRLPEKSLFEDLYPKVERRILADTELPKGWHRERTRRTSLWFDGLPSRWMGDEACAKAVEGVIPEPLEIKFNGSMVGLFGERDGVTVPFRVSIDGQPVAAPKAKPEDENIWRTDSSKMSPPKAGSGILFSWVLLSKNLPDGEHTLRIEPIFEGADPKAELRIESVCSAGR